MNYSQTNYRKISIIAAVVIGIAGMLVPGATLYQQHLQVVK
jgi:hypothetical protein